MISSWLKKNGNLFKKFLCTSFLMLCFLVNKPLIESFFGENFLIMTNSSGLLFIHKLEALPSTICIFLSQKFYDYVYLLSKARPKPRLSLKLLKRKSSIISFSFCLTFWKIKLESYTADHITMFWKGGVSHPTIHQKTPMNSPYCAHRNQCRGAAEEQCDSRGQRGRWRGFLDFF